MRATYFCLQRSLFPIIVPPCRLRQWLPGCCLRQLSASSAHQNQQQQQPQQPVVVRFAPSPTGRMHVGGARTALVNFAFARRHRTNGGRFLLRLEDTDAKRCRPDAVEDILESLNWLGLRPDNADSILVQSQRLDKYREAADRLVASGLAYPCFCSEHRLELLRRHQRQAGMTPGYDGKCRLLSQEERQQLMKGSQRPVIRFNMRTAAERLLNNKSTSSSFESTTTTTTTITIRVRDLLLGDLTFPLTGLEADPVLLKSDGWPVYHLASVFDDRSCGVTHVIRGREWLPSAPKHVLLRAALDSVYSTIPVTADNDYNSPLLFAHLPLLLDWRDGAKLSKRKGGMSTNSSSSNNNVPIATEISELRQLGYLPEAVIDWLVSATWTGRQVASDSDRNDTSTSSSIIGVPGDSLKEFCQSIELNQHCLASRDARLDPNSLRSAGLRSLSPEFVTPTAVRAVRDRLADGDCGDQLPSDAEVHRCLATLRGRLATLADVDSHRFLFRSPNPDTVWRELIKLVKSKKMSSDTEAVNSLALAAMDLLAAIASSAHTDSLSARPPLHYKAARILLTGAPQGPSVREICEHLGSTEVEKRLSELRKTLPHSCTAVES